MNDKDQFEKRLQELPQRPIPAAWRQQILSAATEATSSRRLRSAVRPTLLSNLSTNFTRLLWPHPTAWAALAAVWFLVLGLNFAAREPARPEAAHAMVPASPQMLEMLRQQQQMLAELAGSLERPEASHHKVFFPQPRSQRRQEFFNA